MGARVWPNCFLWLRQTACGARTFVWPECWSNRDRTVAAVLAEVTRLNAVEPSLELIMFLQKWAPLCI